MVRDNATSPNDVLFDLDKLADLTAPPLAPRRPSYASDSCLVDPINATPGLTVFGVAELEDTVL